MSRKVHRIEIASAWVECPFCPTIIVGRTPAGQTVYARYRSGILSVRFDPRSPAPHGGVWGLVLLEGQYGEANDGHMTYDELKEHSANVVAWPDDLSPQPANEDEGAAENTNEPTS